MNNSQQHKIMDHLIKGDVALGRAANAIHRGDFRAAQKWEAVAMRWYSKADRLPRDKIPASIRRVI